MSVEFKYSVVSVDKSESPDGIDEGNWYRYILARGESTLEGCSKGTLKQVTDYAESLAEDLNARSGLKGRSVWAPSQLKK